jgi:predicted MFS family arabinose efflux permease
VVAFVVALGVLVLVPAVVPVAPVRTMADASSDGAVPSLRRTWSVLLTSLLMPFAVFELLASSAPHTQQAFGFTPAQQGVLFIMLGTGSVAGGVFSGALADRFGRRRCLLGSLLGFALLVPVLPFCGANGFRLVATLLGFISTIRQGPFQALASYFAGDGGRGRFSARILTASALGIAAGQFFGSFLLGRYGLGAVAWSSAAATALAIACARPLREPEPKVWK